MSIPTDAVLARLVGRVARRVLAAGGTLATAESCTGGYLAKVITDRPGSSAWFERGWVTYSNRAKRQDLKVPAGTLKRHGAVSEPAALAMARGALAAARARLAVAVTGIAGPDGGLPDKPVGTVWIAWARRGGSGTEVQARRFQFRGSRDAIRRRTVAAALEGLLAE